MLKLLSHLFLLNKLSEWSPVAVSLLAAIIHSYYVGRWV